MSHLKKKEWGKRNRFKQAGKWPAGLTLARHRVEVSSSFLSNHRMFHNNYAINFSVCLASPWGDLRLGRSITNLISVSCRVFVFIFIKKWIKIWFVLFLLKKKKTLLYLWGCSGKTQAQPMVLKCPRLLSPSYNIIISVLVVPKIPHKYQFVLFFLPPYT